MTYKINAVMLKVAWTKN